MSKTPPVDASLEAALAYQAGWGREATAAHPSCSCREHDHELDACIGPGVIFRREDGTEYELPCRILGGVEASSREACLMHGRR